MSVLEARAALRAGLMRLAEAMRVKEGDDPEYVKIKRRDLEMMMAFCQEKKLDGKVALPNLHPRQK